MKVNRKTPSTFNDYKKLVLKDKIMIITLRLLIVVGFFCIWELGANLGFFDVFLVSKPSAIWDLFLTYLQSGELMRHVGISVYETLLGLFIGTVSGVIIAIILYLFPTLFKILDPILVVLNALPKTALAPVIIIWIGTGVKGIVAVSVSLSVVVTIIQAHSYFKGVDSEKQRMLKSYGASKWQLLTKLVLPSNFANLISLVKINIGLAWVGVIVGEFLVSRGGIGYLVVYGGQVFKLDLVMMGVLILAVIAFLMYEVVAILEKYLQNRDNRRRKHEKN